MRSPGARRLRAAPVLLTVLIALTTACQGPAGPGAPVSKPAATTSASPGLPTTSPGDTGTTAAAGKIGHVFVINLENESYAKTWGPDSAAPYLSGTLRNQGVLLTRYYGIAHHSNPNYLAQISGQGSNPMTRNDCTTYAPFTQTGTAAPGQVLGTGCLYPSSVPTVAGQLSAAGKTWKAYMEDMGTPCRHPEPGARDDAQNAKINDQYATRHNPFVYFSSITSSPDCQNNVVDYSNLATDLQNIATTPNLAYISPNLCHDGHDSPCVDGEPGGLVSADAWLKEQVPAILDSPAYRQDGTLIITFDETDGNATGPSGLPGGTAGGLVGALVLSPFTSPGTSTSTMYNHYSLLATIEDIFSLPRLGYAGAAGQHTFGPDVYNVHP
ncbi:MULTISPECIES: alkaline phosphatase family protein [Arthrobacter]|uniref:Phosphoesterase n=1 Tax=Arthrobacter terricola TaxID=2547396 RepID=A0A4R5KBS8_9MICC|nr:MULTISPECIES: alkaline phosphatase family protein [Arthrobacter]MBT8161786.1 alkaline phosphatase family protein [Arthrobacter sp. GN70]TDF92653.1 phosphoesterase [Arthrobacter terricola]